MADETPFALGFPQSPVLTEHYQETHWLDFVRIAVIRRFNSDDAFGLQKLKFRRKLYFHTTRWFAVTLREGRDCTVRVGGKADTATASLQVHERAPPEARQLQTRGLRQRLVAPDDRRQQISSSQFAGRFRVCLGAVRQIV